jgi:hypothetical protein
MRDALINHRTRLDGVRQLLLLLKKAAKTRRISLTFSDSERRIASPIYSAASILPIAYFEIFIEKIILRLIDHINANSHTIDWTKLPPKIRKVHLENAIFELKEIKRKEPCNIEEISEHIKSIINYTTQPYLVCKYACEIEDFLKSKANYHASRINDLFNSIGLTDIFSLISQQKFLGLLNRELIRDRLEELCNRRDKAAHGVDILNTGVTIQNLEEGIDFIYNISESFVVILENYRTTILLV